MLVVFFSLSLLYIFAVFILFYFIFSEGGLYHFKSRKKRCVLFDGVKVYLLPLSLSSFCLISPEKLHKTCGERGVNTMM